MTTPMDPQVGIYSHANGHVSDLLDRLAVSEICKGWPVYRDASEWKNFRSLFCEDAFVWTTWSKRQSVDNFIRVSKEGKARGDFIMHRECGTSVDLNPETGRAVGKMKATITQRFTIKGDTDRGVEPIAFDVDCDCRFHFFCFKQQGEYPQWKIRYVKLIYEKDKVIPVDGKSVPTFSQEMLRRCPEGYQYLGAAQRMLGHDIDEFLPTIQGKGKGAAHFLWIEMYEKMGQWLEGADDIDLSSPAAHVGNGINGKAHRNGHANGNGNGHVHIDVNANGHIHGHGNGNGFHATPEY